MSETIREQTKPAERKKFLAERLDELGNSTSPLGLDASHEPPEEPVAPKVKRAKPAEHQKPLAERMNELGRPPQLWRLPRVLEATGLRKSQLLDAVQRGDFPAPVKILEGGRAVAWLDLEVIGYICSRVAVRDRELEPS